MEWNETQKKKDKDKIISYAWRGINKTMREHLSSFFNNIHCSWYFFYKSLVLFRQLSLECAGVRRRPIPRFRCPFIVN